MEEDLIKEIKNSETSDQQRIRYINHENETIRKYVAEYAQSDELRKKMIYDPSEWVRRTIIFSSISDAPRLLLLSDPKRQIRLYISRFAETDLCKELCADSVLAALLLDWDTNTRQFIFKETSLSDDNIKEKEEEYKRLFNHDVIKRTREFVFQVINSNNNKTEEINETFKKYYNDISWLRSHGKEQLT